MSDVNSAVEAAWAYEGLHVDALFRQWAAPVLDAASVGPGDSVLDVACGTGVLAREALGRVGPTGTVTGFDIGAGMLEVARSLAPGIRWVEGDAGQLPFDDDEFDAVVSQFGLMFFPDQVRAIREMTRCARRGAPIVVAVWDALERSEAYRLSVELLERLAGSAAADALRAPFALGDRSRLLSRFDRAGVGDASVETLPGTARFPSVRTMVEADLRGWLPVMGVELSDDLVEQILAEAEGVLADFVTTSGEMEFDVSAHVVTVRA